MSEHRRVSICNGFNVNGTVKWVEVESRTTPNDYYEHLISNFKTRSKIPFLNSFFKYKSLKFFRKRKKCIDIVFFALKKKLTPCNSTIVRILHLLTFSGLNSTLNVKPALNSATKKISHYCEHSYFSITDNTVEWFF